MSTYLLVSK